VTCGTTYATCHQPWVSQTLTAAAAAAAAAGRLPADLGCLSVLQHLDVSKNMLWALPQEVRIHGHTVEGH
jgi:hypothetical protein